MPDPSPLLRSAVQAARSGDRDQAIDLLLELVEKDSSSPRAWIELSKLVDDPEDQETALKNALALCPGDERIENRLDKLYAEHPFLKPTQLSVEAQEKNNRLYYQAAQLAQSGVPGEAERKLRQIVQSDPRNGRAWLLLGEVQADPKARARALEKAVSIDPLNEEAWRRLENIRHIQHDPLKRGLHLEERGDYEQALQVYLSITVHSRSAVERREAHLRIDQIKLRQEADEIHPVHPDLNLVRLTVGPVLLFCMMVFVQSGLNLLHTPLLAVPGMLSVLFGSLLLAATDMKPAHPKWVDLFGRPGTGEEPEMRQGLRLLGVALMIAPYTMFLIEAGHRLGVLQASMLGQFP